MQATAKHLLDLLHRHYIRDPQLPTGIFAPEIGAPDSDRRADLIWQGITRNSGLTLIGHEIKVTRADLRAELDDPTKADSWKQHCDRWYLVIPDLALTRGMEIPEDWGILTPPSGRRTRSMTVEREATDLHPVDQTPGVRTVAAWLHWRHIRLQHEESKKDHEIQWLRDNIAYHERKAQAA